MLNQSTWVLPQTLNVYSTISHLSSETNLDALAEILSVNNANLDDSIMSVKEEFRVRLQTVPFW